MSDNSKKTNSGQTKTFSEKPKEMPNYSEKREGALVNKANDFKMKAHTGLPPKKPSEKK